jgi:hypothetical protein
MGTIKHELLDCWNDSCCGLRMRVIAEQKNSFRQLLTNRPFSIDFNISLLRSSSRSCALLQVMCRSIAVPKQNQNHFISIGLGFKLLPLCGCGVFPLDTLSFTAWFIIMVTCHFTLDSSLLPGCPSAGSPGSLQRTCFCYSTSCHGTRTLQTVSRVHREDGKCWSITNALI